MKPASVDCPVCGAKSPWVLGGSFCFSLRCQGNTFIPGHPDAEKAYADKHAGTP